MNFKKTALAVATTAALALGLSQNAMADVYAGSRLDVRNLTIGFGGLSDGGVQTYKFDVSNSATLNNVSAGGTTSASCNNTGTPCSTTSPVLAAPVANAPGGTLNRADNDFSFLGGTTTGQTFSNSDSQITTSQVVQQTSPPTLTSAIQISEAQLSGTGSAQANTVVQSTTTFTLSFSIPENGGSFSMTFEADPDMMVGVNTPGLQGASGQASTSATFSLTGETALVTWDPNGRVDQQFDDCTGVTLCLESADAEDLVRVVPIPAGNPSSRSYSDDRAPGSPDQGFQSYGISITGLSSGSYTLVLTAATAVSIAQSVPEPGILGLMGIGLLGVIGSVRRRKSAA